MPTSCSMPEQIAQAAHCRRNNKTVQVQWQHTKVVFFFHLKIDVKHQDKVV